MARFADTFSGIFWRRHENHERSAEPADFFNSCQLRTNDGTEGEAG
jgi:hypothetical protein